jgi:hypothetical protein
MPSEIARVNALAMAELIVPTTAPHSLHLSVTCYPSGSGTMRPVQSTAALR